MNAARLGTATCPRCGGMVDVDISEPWKRPDGCAEWVKIRPHLHVRTYRSTCRPKGYARRVVSDAVGSM